MRALPAAHMMGGVGRRNSSSRRWKMSKEGNEMSRRWGQLRGEKRMDSEAKRRGGGMMEEGTKKLAAAESEAAVRRSRGQHRAGKRRERLKCSGMANRGSIRRGCRSGHRGGFSGFRESCAGDAWRATPLTSTGNLDSKPLKISTPFGDALKSIDRTQGRREHNTLQHSIVQ